MALEFLWADWFSLRWLVRLGLLSIALTLFSVALFHRNPTTSMVLAKVAALTLLAGSAAALLQWDVVWTVPSAAFSGYSLAAPVPAACVYLWLTVAGALLIRRLWGLLAARRMLAALREVRDVRAHALLHVLQDRLPGHRCGDVEVGRRPLREQHL